MDTPTRDMFGRPRGHRTGVLRERNSVGLDRVSKVVLDVGTEGCSVIDVETSLLWDHEKDRNQKVEGGLHKVKIQNRGVVHPVKEIPSPT